jgi:ribosome-associated translation inhibitor RaiA
VVERNANSFETAINECADILKEKLTRLKEKRND